MRPTRTAAHLPAQAKFAPQQCGRAGRCAHQRAGASAALLWQPGVCGCVRCVPRATISRCCGARPEQRKALMPHTAPPVSTTALETAHVCVDPLTTIPHRRFPKNWCWVFKQLLEVGDHSQHRASPMCWRSTGGYRKTPFFADRCRHLLRLGLICQVLEHEHPEPVL